ncbi:carnitine O-acetyltransferase isoform X1 [Tribolium castaneum]|uniref:carnitine O-acetyltransferase isoform X1 n=2 Tax=Tribolium castaneum TaxID=7070 RepID=UPI0030FF34BB
MLTNYERTRLSTDKMMLSRTRLLTPRTFKGLYNRLQNQALTMSHVAAPQPQKLPHLPVPKLSQTLEKYLKSVEPFLNESELSNTRKVVTQFQSEDGLGPKLQKLLVEKAQETDNWLADWWLTTAYLGYRDPVVVYSSPGLVFPFQKFGCEEQRLEYAAKLIAGALSYKELIDSGKMPVEKMGKDPLDMNQYKKIFGTCRIPGVKVDHLEYNPQSRHIVIVRNNNFFKLQVINECGKMLNTGELISCLSEIVQESQQMGPPVGILTSENRNNWGRAYQDLTLDMTSLKSVREIQTSLFLVCLDKALPNCGESERVIASKQFIHGGGSGANAANRWYDKTVQFIVSEDGCVGLTYEHSPSEGQPIAVMTDYIVDYIKNDTSIQHPDVRFNGEPEKLQFNIDESVQKAISVASANVDKLAANLDLDSFQFGCYGKEFVKSQKMSPDSFIQIAIQYAFYRIHKVPGAHYESAATRKYIHGRTETIRSCSNESIAFAKAMLSDCKSDSEKVSALKEAVNAHKKYSIEAVNGFGVDRHLLGLKLTALENNLPIPQLFSDPSYTRSTHMRISTSQVATKCDGFMCYAPLVPDGYGCCYNPRANDMNFAVSAFVEHPDTTATQFRKALEESLQDMHDVLAKTQKSKL